MLFLISKIYLVKEDYKAKNREIPLASNKEKIVN